MRTMLLNKPTNPPHSEYFSNAFPYNLTIFYRKLRKIIETEITKEVFGEDSITKEISNFLENLFLNDVFQVRNNNIQVRNNFYYTSIENTPPESNSKKDLYKELFEESNSGMLSGNVYGKRSIIVDDSK